MRAYYFAATMLSISWFLQVEIRIVDFKIDCIANLKLVPMIDIYPNRTPPGNIHIPITFILKYLLYVW